ncbi:MAG TPA: ribonucleotide reductase N-terminal alpha domain-containing protein, partial [Chroococcales cyanobacterium]
MAREDYTNRYWESTQETLVGLYGKRDPDTGLPVESVNDIIHRVAQAVAIAELKYALTTQELTELTIEDAVKHAKVEQWAKTFADNIGNQRFWANTPANINADPEVSLKVLQYWAHGKLANIKEEEIWLRSEELRLAVAKGKT